MTTYRMDDGTVVKTENATQTWDEATRFDGHSNRISVATGSQWDHETLYRSRKGRYWIEHTSQRGSKEYAEWIGNHAAAQWLLHNQHALPEDLKALEEEVSE